jgi:uncharacterized membrane protein
VSRRRGATALVVALRRARQTLILRLRVLVPTLFFLTLVSGATATVLSPNGARFVMHGAGLVALAVFIGVTLLGTVPINRAALDWDPAAPPPDWRATFARWERLDIVRTWAAGAAFGLFVGASLA